MSWFAQRLAGQLREPSGVAGRAIGHILNRGNRTINSRAVERLDLTGTESVLEIGFGGVSDIPYGDGCFDRVLTAQTIYFWPDSAAGLREIHRILAPEGRLMLATATFEEMEKRSFTRHGFRKFRDADLETLLRGAGFSEVVVERDGSRVFSTGVKAESA